MGKQLDGVLLVASGCAVLVLLLVAGHLDISGGYQTELEQTLPPGTHLLADALRDVAEGAEPAAGAGYTARSRHLADTVKGKQRAAAKHTDTNLQRMAMAMRLGEKIMSPLASMPRSRVTIDKSLLPAFGSRQWKLAKAKADVRVSSLQLTVDKEKRRLDAERDMYSKLYTGPVGEELFAKEQLAARVKNEVASAKAMEAKARMVSDNVVKDLNVKNGHIDIKQWYMSQAADKSAQDSTQAVKEAKKLWGKAQADRQTLHKVFIAACERLLSPSHPLRSGPLPLSSQASCPSVGRKSS